MHASKKHYDELASMFYRLFGEASFELPEAEKTLIDDLLEHTEYGVAYDVLIDALREHKIPLTEDDFRKIRAIGELMNLDTESLNEFVSG